MLSDESLTLFLVFARVLIVTGFVPSQVAYLLISLIPKPSGGTRPIGVFPSLVRFISRICRHAYGEGWLSRHHRDYHFGKKGKSSLACVWRMSALCEYAFFRELSVNLTMFDICKAFEHVNHQFFIEQAVIHGFDLCLLRWIINLYRVARHIVVGGVCTKAVHAWRTIVPGDSFADILMFLALVSATDSTAHRYKGTYIGSGAEAHPSGCQFLLLLCGGGHSSYSVLQADHEQPM